MVSLRKNLIKARQNKNLTQIDIAERLEISERQYQNLEAGTSNGSIRTWYKLKNILNSETIDYLLEQEADDTNLSKE